MKRLRDGKKAQREEESSKTARLSRGRLISRLQKRQENIQNNKKRKARANAKLVAIV